MTKALTAKSVETRQPDPARRLEIPYGRAQREAAAAVVEAFEAILAAGALRGPGRPTGTG